MQTDSNFDRAKKLMAHWPEWKRNYQLTKGVVDNDANNHTKHEQIDGPDQGSFVQLSDQIETTST